MFLTCSLIIYMRKERTVPCRYLFPNAELTSVIMTAINIIYVSISIALVFKQCNADLATQFTDYILLYFLYELER